MKKVIFRSIYTPSNRFYALLLGTLLGAFVLSSSFQRSVFISNKNTLALVDTVDYPFKFRDVGGAVGLIPGASNIRGHSAAWGDVNGDGWPDLYVGTFNDYFSKTNMLFINNHGQFTLSEVSPDIRISSRSTGSIFADLDNDGDLDLYVGSMPNKLDSEDALTQKRLTGTSLFENRGDGEYINISKGNEATPENFGGRSVTAFDYDGDGLLDLIIGEDYFYVGKERKPRTRLFRNKGNLRFEDVTDQAGLPKDMPGYGVAAADVNNDGWPDFFVASAEGGNKLFINNKDGTFTGVKKMDTLFDWPRSGRDNLICGISFGDINRDGRLDIVLGPHYLLPAKNKESVRVFLNMGNDQDGIPNFKEITKESGLKPIGIKLPHVEFQDMNNDGWPDIVTSAVRFKDGIPYPIIFMNKGLNGQGIPEFEDFYINDYPTQEDIDVSTIADPPESFAEVRRAVDGFWEKTLPEGKIIYGAPAPTADFNKDGKLDIFMASWWPDKSSLLLQNETPGGNWLQVEVEGKDGVNRMGVGSKINVYQSGQLGKKKFLIGSQDISIGYGYASGHEAIAHFGLGNLNKVDVEVILPHNKGKISKENVSANQRLQIQ